MKALMAGILTISALANSAGQGIPAPPRPLDPNVLSALREIERKTLAVLSLSADVKVVRTFSGKTQTASGSARFLRPNFARMELKGKLAQTVAANGRQLWVYNSATKQFVTRTTKGREAGISSAFGPLIPLAWFFNPGVFASHPPAGTRGGLEQPLTFNGIKMRVIALVTPQMEIRLYAGPEGLIHRSVTTATRNGVTSGFDVSLSNMRLNEPMKPSSFAYRLPKGASEMPGSVDVKVSPPSGKQNRP